MHAWGITALNILCFEKIIVVLKDAVGKTRKVCYGKDIECFNDAEVTVTIMTIFFIMGNYVGIRRQNFSSQQNYLIENYL
jgi:hypothetical protein